MDAEKLWHDVLKDLELQTTRATFEAHLVGTSVQNMTENTLNIVVPNQYSREWVEARLRPLIEGCVEQHVGRPLSINLTGHKEQPALTSLEGDDYDESADEIIVRIRHTDPRDWGRPEVIGRYDLMFWQPLLGPKSFCLWLTLRMFEDAPEPPSLTTLADIVFNGGGRRRILGRYRKKDNRYTAGAIDPLEEHGIAHVSREERSDGTAGRYYIDVLKRLPIMTPAQVSQLSKRRQESHDRVLEQLGVDKAEWRQLVQSSLAAV